MPLRKIYPLLPIFLAILISINFFWILPLLPGFDTPFYLSEIRRFSYTFPGPLSYLYPDRYLTMALPALLIRLFNLDPVIALRISITAIYILIACAIYKLTKNLTKNKKVASILSSGIIISPFLIIYSSTLYANFAGLLVIFTFFAVETTEDFKYKNIVLGLIFGLIFYTHNFTSVSFGLITMTYFVIKALFYKDLSIIKKAIIMFVVACLVGVFALCRYFPIKIASAYASEFSDTVSAIIHKINLPNQPAILGNEKERIITAFKEHSGKYWLYFFLLFLVINLFTKSKEIIKEKKRFILPLALFFPGLILSFQPSFGTNWLPERFVTYVSLSTFFFYISLITLPSYKKYIIFLAAIPLFLNYIDTDHFIMNKGYRAYSQDEQSTYAYIRSNINSDSSIILLSTDHLYWAHYLLEAYTLQSGEHFISCSTIKGNAGYNEINYSVAKIYGSSNIDESSKDFQLIQSSFPNKKIFMLVDSSTGCSSGKIIEKLPGIVEVFNLNNWHIYEAL